MDNIGPPGRETGRLFCSVERYDIILLKKFRSHKPYGGARLARVQSEGYKEQNNMSGNNYYDVLTKLKGKKVLIVDDNEVWTEVLGEMIEDLEMVVDVALNDVEAIKKCRTIDPNLVIMDIKLEGSDCDGIDLAIKINEIEPRAILFITGETKNGEYLEKAQKAKFTQYLLKPFKYEDLIIQIYMTLSNFLLINTLIAELEELKDIIKNRKDIDQAKGILMDKKKLSEKEAYAYLRSKSQKENTPMVEVAKWIIKMQDIL
jgi:AmiR/NasT family two-component response regulator